MRYAELRDALPVRDGKAVVSPASLTRNLEDLWLRCFSGQPLVIAQAEYGPDDDQNETVVILGRSTYLNEWDAPVELRAMVDPDGNVQVAVRFKLLGEMPSLADWNFSRSFPNLPTVIDWTKTRAQAASVPLSELYLFNASYVVVSQPGQDPATGVPLQTGINFVSAMRPTGAVGIVESVFGQSNPLTLYGTVRLPLDTEITVPLREHEFPWDLAEAPPGILLQADLGLGLKIAGLELSEVLLRFYWPHTQAWQEQNITFLPRMAYAGKLSVPSAGLLVDVLAPTEPGSTELLLLGHFEGFSLAKLASLADVIGTGDLISHMPDEIQKVGDALGRLELTHAMISLSLSEASGFEVGMTSVTFGIPELNWQVWDDHFVVDSLECRVTVLNPFSIDPLKQPKLEVMLLGAMEIEGVPIRIRAGTQDKFTVYAELAEQQTIPLSGIWKSYAGDAQEPDDVPIGDLTVNTFSVMVAPFRQYAFALALAGQPDPWVIDVGKTKLRVSDVVLAFSYPRGGPFAGSFGGAITFGHTATLAIRYDTPFDLLIKGIFPKIKLSEMLEAMVSDTVEMPGDFDLTFSNAYVLIQKVGENFVFRVGTTVENAGVFVLEIRRTSSTGWGIAAGIDLSNALGLTVPAPDEAVPAEVAEVLPSALPGMEALKFFEEYFQLQKFLVVLCTFEDTNFTFPDMAQFNNPVIAGGRLTLPGKSGVIAGLNVYANWVINTSDKKQKLLKELLGLDPSIAVTLQVGKNPYEDARLYVGYNTQIAGMPFAAKFGGQLASGSIGLFLEGALTVKIQGQPQTFDAKLDFVPNGAFLSATMKGNTPIDFEVFKIGNLALVIGVSWECIPSLGIAGTLAVGDFESSIAVFFDSVEPQKSMVAGAISDLSLKDVLDTLVGDVTPSDVDEVLEQIGIFGTHSFEVDGGLAASLDAMDLGAVATAFGAHGFTIPSTLDSVYFVVAEAGKCWFLTDLKNQARHYQLKKQDTGTIKVSLEAQFFCAPQRTQIGALPPFDAGFYLNGRLQIAGFHSESTVLVSPYKGISVDSEMSRLVIYDENLFALTGFGGEGGPKLSIATFYQPEQTKAEFRPPHIYINGHLGLLGITREAYISLTTKGLAFDLNGDLSPLLWVDLHGRILGPSDMGVGGAVKMGIGDIDLGPLGKIPIETGVEGQLDLSVEGAKAYLRVAAGCEFAGQSLTLPDIELDVKTSKLTELPDKAYHIVKKALEDLLTDASQWANYVAKGFINGVEDMESVLKETWGKTEAEAKKIVEDVYGTASKACSVTSAALKL